MFFVCHPSCQAALLVRRPGGLITHIKVGCDIQRVLLSSFLLVPLLNFIPVFLILFPFLLFYSFDFCWCCVVTIYGQTYSKLFQSFANYLLHLKNIIHVCGSHIIKGIEMNQLFGWHKNLETFPQLPRDHC